MQIKIKFNLLANEMKIRKLMWKFSYVEKYIYYCHLSDKMDIQMLMINL